MESTRNLDAALRDLAGRLREDIPQLVERSLAQQHDEAPEFFTRDDDPEFVEAYRQSFVQQLRFIYDGLEGGRDLQGIDPPPLAVEEARMSANLGIKLGALLVGYRIAHRLIFEEAMLRAHERIADQELRAAVLRVTSRWLFAYIDWVMARMTDVYDRERDLLVRDRERRMRQIVRDLLDGQPVDAGQLRYDLEARHIGVVAWGREPDRALAALRDATSLTLLTVAGTDTTTWGWLGGREVGDTAQRGIHDFVPPAGSRVALGELGDGAEGFRLTHRQALNTYRIARDGTEAVTRHGDVALLALTLQDPTVAREFVLRELGPLAGSDERSELLRDTLSAYFATGQNAAAAAAALGVHDRTVLYRLRSIEERLGRSILVRREEIGVALKLAPIVLAPPRRGD